TLTMTGAGEPERVAAGTASGDFFATLGVPLALGRTFNREEEPQGANNAVILSHDFWQRKFAGNPAVVGQALTLNGRSHTIIGVLPQRFKAPQELQTGRVVELWVPPGFSPANLCCSHELQAIGRLRTGQSLARAQAEISTIIAGVIKDYAEMYPKDGSAKTFLTPFQQEVVGDVGRTLWILLAAVLFVLLIACANVANLLLVRGEARQKEMAVRVALGAGRARIIRQLLAESSLLALFGGGCGLLLAQWGLGMLQTLGAGNLPRLQDVALDRRVFVFTLLLSLLTGTLFGLAPALQA